jgi:aminoglycoside 6'-N-acetyltransferase
MENNEIILRNAMLVDLATLNHWDNQPHVIDSDPNDDWNWEIELTRQVPWREQLISELNKRPIGFIQIIDPKNEETHYWGDVEENLRAIDIWIGSAADLSRGYGTSMMKLALARCFANPKVKAVLIDPLVSNKHVHRFYERLGFQFVEERWFSEDLCRVYELTRKHYETI